MSMQNANGKFLPNICSHFGELLEVSEPGDLIPAEQGPCLVSGQNWSADFLGTRHARQTCWNMVVHTQYVLKRCLLVSCPCPASAFTFLESTLKQVFSDLLIEIFGHPHWSNCKDPFNLPIILCILSMSNIASKSAHIQLYFNCEMPPPDPRFHSDYKGSPGTEQELVAIFLPLNMNIIVSLGVSKHIRI